MTTEPGLQRDRALHAGPLGMSGKGSYWLPTGLWLCSIDTSKTLKCHRKRGGGLGVRDDIGGTDSE
jgi:hypothetical protein